MSPRTVVVIGCAVVGPLLFAGCGEAPAVQSQPPPTVIQPYAPDAADAGFVEEPMEPEETTTGTAVARAYQGSSLCNASRQTGCYPDDVISSCYLPPNNTAAAAASDAAVEFTLACHVVSDGLFPTTKCEPSTVAGMYASTCAHPTECSPGFECVEGGTCRHYCCAGNSACSDNQFCDVQPVADSPGTLVPVCVPRSNGLNGLPCVLLKDGSCPADEQCSVVRDDGATSCITVGTAGDGESCEQEHCISGYVCLGSLGSRSCEKLCSTLGSPSCPTGRTCIATLPLFTNPTVGVCQ
jgi:hypothetical protein